MFSSPSPSSVTSKSFLTSTSTFLSKRFSSNSKAKSTSTITNSDKKYNNMGGAGRSCADTIRRSRQNVAIATQVLSPRAIGSSLKCQRGAVKHFGPPDDDEEGFLTFRRRTAWKKLLYYGGSIIAIILIITAIIIAVGFLQSEKHKRILTRSPSLKLTHEKKPMPTSYLYNTTPDPIESLEPTESEGFLPTASSSFLVSSSSKEVSPKEDETAPISEETQQTFAFKEQQDDYSHIGSYYDPNDPIEYEEGTVKDKTRGNQGHLLLPFLNGHGPFFPPSPHPSHHHRHHHHREGEHDGNEEKYSDDDEQDIDFPNNETFPKPLLTDNDSFNEDVKAVISAEKESVNKIEENNSDWKSFIVENHRNSNNNVQDGDEDETTDHGTLVIREEVKVIDQHLPKDDNDDAVFSIEVPIYTTNKTIKVDEHNNDPSDNGTTSLELLDETKTNPTNNVDLIKDESNTDVEDFTHNHNDHEAEEENSETNNDVDSYEIQEAKTATDKVDMNNDDDNGTFHRAVLHTALFHLEDDHSSSKVKPEVIEDEDNSFTDSSFETISSHESHNEPKPIITPKYRHLEKRIRGRNRKIKLYQNDKVLNLKATYTPIGYDGQDKNNLEEIEEPLETKSKKINNNSSTIISKPNSDFVNIRDFVAEIKRRPLTPSPSRNFPKLSKAIPELDETEGTPRLLSSGPATPSLEAILKSIFSSNPSALHNTQNYQTSNNNLHAGLSNQQEINHLPQFPNQDYGTRLASSLNQLISPVSLFPNGGNLNFGEKDSSPDSSQSQFSKRTFNLDNHDFLNNPPTFLSSNPQTENYFGHLLGQNPSIGSIGSPSPIGASLSNYYAPIYTATTTQTAPSFDYTSTGTNDSPRVTGVIPFDLSASYIPASSFSPQSLSTFPHQQQTDQLSQYSQLGFGNFYQAPAPAPGGTLPSYTFSSSNEPDNTNNGHFNPANFGGNLGTLTTAAGQPPTYNTISQGIHLLNLISGVLPQSYFHDQVYPATTQASSHSHKVHNDILGSLGHQQGQTSNLAYPFINSLPNLGLLGAFKNVNYYDQPQSQSLQSASSDIASKTEKPTTSQKPQEEELARPRPSTTSTSSSTNVRSVFHFDPDHADGSPPPTDSDLLSEDEVEDDDQLPSASAHDQNLSVKVPPPPKDFKKLKSFLPTSTPITPSLQGTLAFTRSEDGDQSWKRKKSKNEQSEPRSFSFQILPQKYPKNLPQKGPLSSSSPPGSLIEDAIRSLNPDVIHTSLDNYVSESKSRKKGSVSLETPKISFYKPNSTITVSDNFSNTSSKKNYKNPRQHNRNNNNKLKKVKDLDSSFYNHHHHNNNDQKLSLNKEHKSPSPKNNKIKGLQKKTIINSNGLKSGFFIL